MTSPPPSPTQLLSFLQGLFTHYHHGYELAKDFSHFQTHLTISIQNVMSCSSQQAATHTHTQRVVKLWLCSDWQTRNRFESTRSEVESLMKKMKENPEEHKNIRQNVMEGYLFIQERREWGVGWVGGVWRGGVTLMNCGCGSFFI